MVGESPGLHVREIPCSSMLFFFFFGGGGSTGFPFKGIPQSFMLMGWA